MAFKTGYEVICSCGAKFTGELYEYIFTEYDPGLKDDILAGEFNWLTCPSCQEHFHIETRFLYRDEKNRLWVWVCKRGEEDRKEELFEELMEKNAHFEDHHLDDRESYRKFLVFGRESLIELLLKEDKDLKRIEGKHLRKNGAIRLIMEENREPGLFLLRGKKVRVAMPLRMPEKHRDLLSGPEEKKRWLRFYSQGLNMHNPYSSYLNGGMKSKWNRIRKKERCDGFDNEFDDFAHSWANYKTDPRGFRARCPESCKFFEGIKKIKVTRKLHSINPKRVLKTGTRGHANTGT